MRSATAELPTGLRVLHWVIVVNFALQVLYGAYMVFVVLSPGAIGPLAGAARALPFEAMTTRRLYASETWIAITGLSLYLGLTEILPRQLGKR